MNKKIFVIGAKSTVAQAILPTLAKNNIVITAGRRGCDVYCDITKSVEIPINCDVVINFAAHFGGLSDEEITSAVETNVLGVLRVCEAAKRANVAHVINISSSFALLPESDSNYSIYALTKRQADELATFYCGRNQLSLTILRPSRVYSDSSIFAKGQPFLYKIIDAVREGEDVTLYGENDVRRNYLHTEDLAEILVRVINNKVIGTFACTNPIDDTYIKIIHAAQKTFAKNGNIIRLTNEPNAYDDMIIHDTDLYEKINYRPDISIEIGLERIKQYAERAI
jgi:nucleoside-diphosphate-sugar epimerase